MTNKPNGVIYIGITDNIDERVKEHKLKLYPKAFTAKYNCDRLVYFEEFKREWKISLIEEMNSSWNDLSENWNLDYNRNR